MNTRAPGFNPDDEPWDAWGDEREPEESYNGRIEATPGPWETTYIPDDLDPITELGRMIEGGNGRVYYVCAPEHPDSGADGVTVISITGNGPTGLDNATLVACVPEMLEVIKLAYRKHHMGDDSIGWDELSDKLGDALNNALGPTGFVDWLMEVKRND